MIDPPPFSSQGLKEFGIPPNLIDRIIISHCHADHDAGSFQKILHSNKVEVRLDKVIGFDDLRGEIYVDLGFFKMDNEIFLNQNPKFMYLDFFLIIDFPLNRNNINLSQIVTTPTIMGSFLRKYSALTGIKISDFTNLFIFRPAVVGKTMQIGGGRFKFFYSYHSIPCIGFEVEFCGKCLYFSGDTYFEPIKLEQLYHKGNQIKSLTDLY